MASLHGSGVQIRSVIDHKFPYLLRNLKIESPNQVWQADMTYIPMFPGFMYMFAIIDVYSRKIMGWDVSNTMSAEWCRDVMRDAMEKHGKPEIFNTYQGSQFISSVFIEALKAREVKISMDQRDSNIEFEYSDGLVKPTSLQSQRSYRLYSFLYDQPILLRCFWYIELRRLDPVVRALALCL